MDAELDKAINMINAQVTVDIAEAKQQNLPWTKIRKFACPEEAVGATRCCHPKCRKAAVYVSYAVGLEGRVVYCPDHAFGRNRRKAC